MTTSAIKIISWILILSVLSYSFGYAEQQPVTLPAGTPVVVELSRSIDSKTSCSNSPLSFRVKYDVRIDDKVLIPAGSESFGRIVNCSKAKELGEPGYLEIIVDNVKARDGTIVKLSSITISREGKSNKGLVIGLVVGGFFVITIWSLFFLLLKGKNVKIDAGFEINTNVVYDTIINVP